MLTTVTEEASSSRSSIGAGHITLSEQENSRKSSNLDPLEIIEPASNATAEDESAYPTGLKFWLIFLSASLVLIIGGLDATIVATAVPALTDHFHTVADVGWYSSAYRLSSCSFQFMFGKLYKIFSLRWMFLVSVAIFVIGSIFTAAAPSSAAFIFGRAVCGFASAGIIQGCFTLLVHTLPLRKRPLYAGLLGAMEGVSVIAAPILGGVIVGGWGWRGCFWIGVPGGGITLIVMALTLTDPRTSREGDQKSWKEKINDLDLVGTLFFIPSLTSLFLAFSWAGTKYPWNSATVIGLFVTFAVLLALFAYEQYRRQDAATLPPRILRNRSVIAGFVFSLCTNATCNVIEYYMPTYFQAVREYTPAKSGLMMLPAVLGFLIAMVGHGAAVSLVGYYVPFMLFASAMMPVFAGLITTWSVQTGIGKIITYSAALGFAGGIGFQAPQTAVQTSLSEADASIGLAIILFAQAFGPALFIAIAQTIFTNRLAENLQSAVPGLTAKAIENMGLTDLKQHVGPENIGKALMGLDESLKQTWYLAVGLACATIVGSVAMEWKSVKQKKN